MLQNREKELTMEKVYKEKKISQSFQRWLLILVAVAFLMTTAFLWAIQTRLSENNAIDLMRLNISDVREDILDASDENLLSLTRQIKKEINAARSIHKSVDREMLSALAEEYEVVEINIVDENGIITASTYRSFLGYNMADGKQSSEFLVLLEGEVKEYAQNYQPISYDASMSRKYGGVALEGGGFIQVGYDTAQFQRDIDETVIGVTRNRHIGEGGSIIIADENWTIVSDRSGNEGKPLSVTGLVIDPKTVPEGESFVAEVYGEPCYCMYMLSEGYYAVAVMPQSEAVLSRNVSVAVTTAMEIVIFAALFIMIWVLIKKLIVNDIQRINTSLSEITAGNLEVTVDVRSHQEFASLSDDINATVDTLKKYIEDAAARIDAELAFAKAIQCSSLPSVFPPYPDRPEFDIWAHMETAKEVGGDFYDFYFLDEETLAFVIADVSGKGIPAAMFMMTAKTVLKSLAQTGMEVQEVFTKANEKLCEGNETGMFVTAWMGYLDTRTGRITFANAGHNPPLVRHADGSFTYLRSRPGLVLAGMEGLRYRKNELQLRPGDQLFLYTDGVTEAIDEANGFYGEDRLCRVLDRTEADDAQSLCEAVQEDLRAFMGSADQFDDITMLSLRYRGVENRREITLEATVENIAQVTTFVDEILEAADCPMKTQMQIDVAIDELFSNIANYAYAPGTVGKATVSAELLEDPKAIAITFTDSGVPYDPLAKADPDTTLSAEEREIGGLGIYLVKKTMDGLYYEYKNGQNILRIKKYL